MTLQPVTLSTALRRHAVECPGRLAVADVTTSMTFAELDAAASAVAAALDAVGTGGAGWLPVLVDRSVASVVALCGAVRAGRPYSPIAADLPAARVAELVQRLGEPELMLVAPERVAAPLPTSSRVVSVAGAVQTEVPPHEGVPVDAEAPAMAVFTSGSTGHPKCVVRDWEMFDRAIADQVALGPVVDGDDWRWGGVQPFTFGGSRALAVLALGGSLMVIDPAAHDTESFLDHLHRWGVVECNLVPSLVTTMLGASRGDRRLPRVRRVLLGGEPVDWDLVEPLRSMLADDAVILHEYGSSEVGRVFVHEVRGAPPVGGGRVPLDRPVARRSVRFDGVEGRSDVRQLMVRDPDSIGYLDDDGLTAARFTVAADGGRWYATGDLFVTTDDGCHHHAGRIDDMVKINGLLVEPREPELVLRSMPGVTAATVLPQRTSAGDWRLVAHLVVDPAAVTPESVRRALEERLPRHLVPAVLVRHDELPVSDRLKVDRSALAASPVTRWRTAPVRPPVDDTERWVIGQVGAVLGDDDVAPDDDLWALGMDSLGAVELCSRLADGGIGEPEPTDLLDHRTPAMIAALLRSGSNTHRAARVSFNSDGSSRPVVVVPGSGGSALAFAAIARELGADQPMVVVEARGMHTRGLPHLRVGSMARHVLAHLPVGLAGQPFVLVGHSGGGAVAHEVAALLAERGPAPVLVLLDPAVGEAVPATSEPFSARDPMRFVAAATRATRLWFGSATGRVRPGPERYRWIHRLHAAAARRHRLRPAPVPVTIVRGAESAVVEIDVPGATSVERLVVGGGHHTMLQPPHAAEVADVLRAVAARVAARVG